MTHINIIKEIAERFRSPDSVKAFVLDPKNYNPNPLFQTRPELWNDLSLPGGFPGILLLTEALQRLEPKEKWDETAHLYVLKIRDAIEQNSQLSFSLHGGVAGICFAILQVSQRRTKYQRLLEKLEDHLIENVERVYFSPLQHNLDNGLPSPPFLYDLISGIVGIGLYGLLCLDREKFVSFVEEITQLLIRLVQPIKIRDKLVPGWYLPNEMQLFESEKLEAPQGNFNAGLAHGIPGVLGFLALALGKGICLPGQKEAIEIISHWLEKKRFISHKGIYWPGKVSWEEEISGISLHHKSRDAWCYGTPGVVRALYLAGDVLKNEALKSQALLGMQSVFERSPGEWGLPAPTICHGIAGLLLMTHIMAEDTQDVKLRKHVKDLETYIWNFYKPTTPFGFQDLELTKSGGYTPLNKAGVLEGASGVLLALLSVAGNTSHWHYSFLLSTKGYS